MILMSLYLDFNIFADSKLFNIGMFKGILIETDIEKLTMSVITNLWWDGSTCSNSSFPSATASTLNPKLSINFTITFLLMELSKIYIVWIVRSYILTFCNYYLCVKWTFSFPPHIVTCHKDSCISDGFVTGV